MDVGTWSLYRKNVDLTENWLLWRIFWFKRQEVTRIGKIA
jgi:hypothetical protein